MPIKIHNIDLHILNMRARMPFRYGIVTMTALPHLFVRAEVEVDGSRVHGISADHLPPKWFTKNPDTHFRDDLVDMIDVIRAACAHAQAAQPSRTVFDLWAEVYAAQKKWAGPKGYPPLLWGFGVSLVERALIDAFCRAKGTTFAEALRQDSLGIDRFMPDEVERVDLEKLRNSRPLRTIIARHTVGLTDPLTDSDIPPGERIDDGLPQSLEQAIRTYGLTHFKIKLGGNVERDIERLKRLAEIVGRNVASDYAFTLDANENFKSIVPFRALWKSLLEDASVREFLKHLLFVEQPLHRDVALSPEVARELESWPDRPPLIIDESDGEMESLREALRCGYVGTSHKNCKGVLKSIINSLVLEARRRRDPSRPYILSGEDLSNVGPVALLQDIAVAANLGITHLERNGHHYFAGLSMFPAAVQRQMLGHHGDLYRPHQPEGYPIVGIRGGKIDIGSTIDAPFGVGFELDTTQFTQLDHWSFESLGLR